MNRLWIPMGRSVGCLAAACLVATSVVNARQACGAEGPTRAHTDRYQFDGTNSREVLEAYLSRAITMEGLLNGRGDLEDNIRMLKRIGAKFVGRSVCLWGREAQLLRNLQRARQQLPLVHAADPEMILQACIFEIVTTQVEQVPVPEWAFAALGQPVEKRNFRYADMLYPSGRFKDHWRRGQSVPDVSRPETKLWFYFLGASYIDLGCEAIHFGQTELMNGNDPNLDHYWQVLTLIRSYAANHARRHMVLCDSHVPSGGLVRDGQLLMDFHSFPLRIMELPDKPQEAILKVGFSDGIYGRSKGGMTPSGWKCEHLPYLVEIDNWGVSRRPGQARAGGIWVWGYDEITWFAHQSRPYRRDWLRYAWDWVRQTDPNGFLQMPGSRTLRSPLDGMRWYYANNPSPSVPDGLGDEDAIRAIWAADSAQPGSHPRSHATRSDDGVDLGPFFEELGLSTRAQGSRGTCSAFTITRAVEYALGKKQPRKTRLSVEFLNWASNEAIGERRDGGFFSDLWKGFESYGICDEDEMPYAAEFDPRLRPSKSALAHAGQCRETGLRLNWIKPWDPSKGLNDEQFAAVKETLRQRWPVCGGFLWPKQPEWADRVLQMASREDVRDGHSVLLVGFRDDPSQPGGGVFLVQNTSKGPRNAAMSYEYVRAYMNDAAWIGYDQDRPSP